MCMSAVVNAALRIEFPLKNHFHSAGSSSARGRSVGVRGAVSRF